MLTLIFRLDKVYDIKGEIEKLQMLLFEKIKNRNIKKVQNNKKLVIIIREQQCIKQKSDEIFELNIKLECKEREIMMRKEYLQNELLACESLLNEARIAMQHIQMASWDTLKWMMNPPTLVKMTLEALFSLLRNSTKIVEWSEIKTEVRKKELIQNITYYDVSSLKPAVIRMIEKKFLNSDAWDLEKIKKSSALAGLIAQWIQCLINFANIRERLSPIRIELEVLEKEYEELKKIYNSFISDIQELERNINKNKTDYEILKDEKHEIHLEIQSIQDNISRANYFLIISSYTREIDSLAI